VESLRQPLETQSVLISRATERLRFPADFILLAAMNPCPCGWHGSRQKDCQCTLPQRRRYFSRISGPIYDRFDLQVWVPAVPFSELEKKLPADPTAEMKERVLRARTTQQQRFSARSRLNGRMSTRDLKRHCELSSSSLRLLEAAATKYRFSARAYTKIINVARTIADLEGSLSIAEPHISEALVYRVGVREET